MEARKVEEGNPAISPSTVSSADISANEKKDRSNKKVNEKSDEKKNNENAESKSSVERIQEKISTFCAMNMTTIKLVFCLLLTILYLIYLSYAIYLNFQNALPLFVFTIIIFAGLFYYKILKRFLGRPFKTYVYLPAATKWASIWQYKIFTWIVYILILAGCMTFLIIDTWKTPFKLISLAGLITFCVICVFLSSNPCKIRWRPVIWGIFLQFVIGIFLLRIPDCLAAFDYLAKHIVEFLSYAMKASIVSHCTFLEVLQTIIFFSAIIAIMYYYGIIQFIMYRLAWIVQGTLDITAAEAFNAVACVFVGMTEGPLMIRPYLSKMTKSEINAMFTAGFSCISGSLFVAYVSFGVILNVFLFFLNTRTTLIKISPKAK